MPRAATKTKEPSQAQLTARAAGAERLRKAAEARQKVRPVKSPKRFVDTDDHEVASPGPREMSSTGPAREALSSSVIEVVDRPVDKDKLANLAFMEEPVTILIHQSDSPTAVQYPEVWNGGRKEIFQRGVRKTTKRKFVEVLARMKMTKYHQEEVTDKDGVKGIRYNPYSALVYPFAVEDDTEKGKDWLRRILAEA